MGALPSIWLSFSGFPVYFSCILSQILYNIKMQQDRLQEITMSQQSGKNNTVQSKQQQPSFIQVDDSNQDNRRPDQSSPCPFLELHRYKIINTTIVALALTGIILSIIILFNSEAYFSKLFKKTDEFTAKDYLDQNFTAILTTVYLSIIGMILILVNTGINFTQFNQKEGMSFFHGLFYVVFLAFGGVAYKESTIVINNLQEDYSSVSEQDCVDTDYKCLTFAEYSNLHQNLILFLVGFSIVFLLYSILFHLNSYWQRKDREAISDNLVLHSEPQLSQNKNSSLVDRTSNQISISENKIDISENKRVRKSKKRSNLPIQYCE